MFRRTVAVAAALVVAVALPASATPDHHHGKDHPGKDVFPERIPLPEGSAPEGIAIGRGPVAYVGSLADGSILQLNLVDGDVEEFAASPGENQVSVGLDVDRRGRLWVAGGGPGGAPGVVPMVRAYDTRTGELVYERTVEAGFVNDVIVTRSAAWFTDSFGSQLIRVPFDRSGIGEPEYVALEGDWQLVEGAFNANGIEAARKGRTLVLAQSTNPDGDGAALYSLPADTDADTLEATRIQLDGVLAGADGLLLRGRTLYSVVGDPPSVARIHLDPGMDRGRLKASLPVPDAVTPTTAARLGRWLYVVDAKFALGGGPGLAYEIIRIPRW